LFCPKTTILQMELSKGEKVKNMGEERARTQRRKGWHGALEKGLPVPQKNREILLKDSPKEK